MRYTAGECSYCDRVTATRMHYGRLTCPESEAESCFTLWQKRENARFDSLLDQQGNDHGK